MNKNRAFILTEGIVGGTFLDWSLFYLSNIKTFYNPLDNTVNTVVDNPLSKSNAHRHNKIHPTEVDELKFCVDKLKNDTNFYSIFPYFDYKVFGNILMSDFLRDGQYDKEKTYENVYDKIKEARQANQNYLLENNFKILIIKETKQDQLYTWFNKARPFNNTPDDEIKRFYNKFFGKIDTNSESFNIWDLREDLALSIRPFDILDNRIDTTSSPLIFEISSTDVFDNLDLYIEKILEFFEIEKTNKINDWKVIYSEWKKIHDTKFHRSWRTIIDNIVTGKDFNLSEYQMDLTKDSFIQHILIYKFNLNIKGHGVTNLPLNTKLINALLEENIHPIDESYREFIKNV